MKLWVTLLLSPIIVLVGAPAMGQTTFTDATGNHNWCVSANWTNMVPSQFANATIQANTIAVVDENCTAAALSVTVEAGARIDIAPALDDDASLDLGGPFCDPDCPTSTITGEIRLLPSVGDGDAILHMSNFGHTFVGTGAIVGQHDNATIDLTSTLTNKTTIRGHLKIVDGTLINWGVINANVEGGKLLIESAVFDDCDCPVSYPGNVCDCGTTDSNDYEYRVQNGGTLEFGAGIVTLDTLEGDFLMSMPALQTLEMLVINEPLTSTGRLNMATGTVKVNQNMTLGSTNRTLRLQVGTIDVAANKQFYHD